MVAPVNHDRQQSFMQMSIIFTDMRICLFNNFNNRVFLEQNVLFSTWVDWKKILFWTAQYRNFLFVDLSMKNLDGNYLISSVKVRMYLSLSRAYKRCFRLNQEGRNKMVTNWVNSSKSQHYFYAEILCHKFLAFGQLIF